MNQAWICPEALLPTVGAIPGSGDPSNAEALVLQAASNALQSATIVWLPDVPLEANPPPAAGALGAVSVAVHGVLTNGQASVTIRLANQTIATAGGPASLMLASAQNGNSAQLLDSLGGCVRPGSGLLGWWPGEGNANDSVGAHNGTLPNGVAFVASEVGQASAFALPAPTLGN